MTTSIRTRIAPLAILLVGAAVFLTSPRTAAADVDVLLVGNSYIASNDLASYMDNLLAEVPAWADPNVASHNPGGRRLVQHLDDADGTNGETQLRQWMVTGSDAWAFVLLQEQSQIPSFPTNHPEVIGSVAAAVGLDDLIEAKGAATVFFQTWGRRDGDTQNPAQNPDYTTMQDNLDAGYEAYRAATTTEERPTWVAPVGTAFRRINALDADLFASLYVGDGSHPSVAGSYLAGLVIQATWSGRDPRRVQWAPAGLDPDDGAALRDAAAAVTWLAADGPLAFPWEIDWADWSNPDDVAPGAYAVSGAGVEPMVTLAEAGPALSRLVIGANHDGLAGSGRLVLAEGAELSAPTVVLGEVEDSRGGLMLVGGALEVELVEGGEGEGWIEFSDGELRAGAIDFELEQTGGEYIPTGLEPRVGSYTQTGGGLQLTMTGTSPALAVAGDAVLGGRLTLDVDATTLAVDQGVVLVRAAAIDVAGLEVVGPEHLAWAVQDDVDGQILVASLGELPPPPEIPDPEDIIDDALASICGCGGDEAAVALLLLMPLGLRRRR